MKGVVFNGGYNAGMFDTIGAADHWVTFGMDISGTGSAAAQAAHIPMVAFASDVPAAVNLVSGPNPPEWLLTFNEPDYAYDGSSPTMTPQQASDAIQPLLKIAHPKTKFVAPVTADPTTDWLPQFYAVCNCQSFFSAYNIHIYHPTWDETKSQLTAFRAKFGDKPTWLTEVAPGGAQPACSLSTEQVGGFMKSVYGFAKTSGWVDRVFWNTGNQIGAGDHNVCNSYLLNTDGTPSALLDAFKKVDCS